MNDLLELLTGKKARPKSDLAKAREILERDPDLRQIRKDHRLLEARVSALEVQAKVRARRV